MVGTLVPRNNSDVTLFHIMVKFIGSRLYSLIDFFFSQEKYSRIKPFKRYRIGSSSKRANKFMFLSLIKVTSSFLSSTQSCVQVSYLQQHFLLTASSGLHEHVIPPAPFPLAFINLLSMWRGNYRIGFCDVVCLKYHAIQMGLFCSPCSFVPIYFAGSTVWWFRLTFSPPYL